VRAPLALTALLALVLAGCGGGKQAAAPTTTAPSASAGFPIDPPVAAPSFLLRDQDDRLVGPQLDRGHPTVVTFLYTHCPDVCPLIADQLASAQRADSRLRVIAVSVDPARDTRAAIRHFLAVHHTGARFRYVRGTRKALAPVWHRYHIAALPGPSGTVSHSAISVLVDAQGRERALFDSKITARSLLRAVAATKS
jgi:protein SCO1